MKIDYYYINPTNNITLLVTSDVSPHLMPKVANELLKLEPTAEQVGYVDIQNAIIKLHMAGGEFCGNATMSAGALKQFLKSNNICKTEYYVKVYGMEDNIKTSVSKISDTEFKCSVCMPNKFSICKKTLEYNNSIFDLPIVSFEGISHIVALDNVINDSIIEDAIKKWCMDLNADCLGIINYNKDTKFLKPVVYVPKLDSLYWENSCASGTTAVAIYLNKVTSCCDFEFLEPGGKLCVKMLETGDIVLNGRVIVEKFNSVNILV